MVDELIFQMELGGTTLGGKKGTRVYRLACSVDGDKSRVPEWHWAIARARTWKIRKCNQSK